MQGEPEICRDFRKGVCFRVNCRYAHINADGTPGTPNDQPVCRDFENGRCFRSNCRFFHRAAPELLAANLANSKRQGEPSPHDLLDRFGPLSLPTHPDYASYGFGSDHSPSGEFSRDTRALLARELAKRELAISNRMLELSLAERALLELSIRERRQALGRLEPSPYQGLGRQGGFDDLTPLGVHPNQGLPSSLNRTRSVPVQGFQEALHRGVAPQRHAEVIAPPRLDRRSSVPAHILDVEAEREAGGFGWQPQGGGTLGEYPNPQTLNRSSSETVQHLQEMRRAADSLLLDLERSRRKESVSMPGSPELMSGERAPRLELDPRVMNRIVGRGPLPAPDGVSEQAQPDGGFQSLERYASLRSGLTSPEMMGAQGLGMQGLQSLSRAGSGIPTPDGRTVLDGLDGRKSPQAFEQVPEQLASRKSPEPTANERFGSALSGVEEEKSEQSMNGIERDVRSEEGILSPDEADPRKSKSLQTSPEIRPAGSQGFAQGFGRANGVTTHDMHAINTNTVPQLELRRAASGIPPQESLLRSMGSLMHAQGASSEALLRSFGSLTPNQGAPNGLVRSMSNVHPNQGLARTGSMPFGGDFAGAPLTRRPSGTPTGFLSQEEPSPQTESSSGLFAQYREQGQWLGPSDQKEMFRHEQSKLFEQDRAVLERALRAQQLGRQVSGGFEGGNLQGHGHEGRGGLDAELASRFAQAGHFRPEVVGPYNQSTMDYARFPPAQQQQQQRQLAPQAQSQQHPTPRAPFAEAAPGPPTPPSETVSPCADSFQEYSPFGGQPSLFKENSGKSIW